MAFLDMVEGAARDVGHRLRDPADARYIVSYPKAGITWLRYMLAQLVSRSYDPPEREPIEGQTVDLEELTRSLPGIPTIIDAHDQSEIAVEHDRAVNAGMLFAYSRRLRFRNRKVLFLIRDPRDIVVSYFHQATKRSSRPVPVADLSEFIRHPVYGFARIVRFYEVWAANLPVPSEHKVVRYEQLREGGGQALLEAARFLDIEAGLELAEQVFDNSSADKMRAREIAGKIEGMRVSSTERDHLKVRKARIGGFREEMSAGDEQFCNALMMRIPEPFHYEP